MTCALWLTPATAAPSRDLVAWQDLAFRVRHPDETGARNSHAAASCHVRCALGSAASYAMSLWDSRAGTFRAVHSPRLHLHPAEARGVEVGVQQHVQVPACRQEPTLTLQLADAMDICCLTRHPGSEEKSEPHMMKGVLQSSALNRKLRLATCQWGPAAGISEGLSSHGDTCAASTSPLGTFKDMTPQLSCRWRADERAPLTWRRSPGSARAPGAPGTRPPGRCPRRPPCPSLARPAAPAHPAPHRPAHTCFDQTSMLKDIWEGASALDQAAHTDVKGAFDWSSHHFKQAEPSHHPLLGKHTCAGVLACMIALVLALYLS